MSMWAMRVDGADHHYVSLLSVKDRNKTSAFTHEQMMLIEPRPLMFVPRDSTMNATMHTLAVVLRDQALTLLELEEVMERKKSTLYEVLTAMKSRGSIVGDGERPERFTIV